MLLCSPQYRQQIIDTIAHSHTHLRTLVGSLWTLVESGVEPEWGGVTTEYHCGPVLPLAYLLDPGPELVSLEEQDEHYLVHHLTLEEEVRMILTHYITHLHPHNLTIPLTLPHINTLSVLFSNTLHLQSNLTLSHHHMFTSSQSTLLCLSTHTITPSHNHTLTVVGSSRG